MILARGGLPGELARVEIAAEKPGMARGRALEILEPSPERISPRCVYFGDCGGCDYQHFDAGAQARAKVSILREVLERIGKIAPPADIEIRTGSPWEYRNRIQLHFEGARLGFHRAGSRSLCPIRSCDVASPKLNEAIGELNNMVRDRRWPSFVRSIELFTNETSTQMNVLDSAGRRLNRSFFEWASARLPGVLDSSLDYAAGGRLFRVSYRSFFQVNRFLIDDLAEEVTGGHGGDHVIELYAGVGLLSLPLRANYAKVTAVEAVASACRDLEFNTVRASVDIETVQSTAEAYLASVTSPPDTIVADPPRAGLGADVTRELARLRAPRIVIVSCDPSTLARDLTVLTGAGYRIERMGLVDLFPQSAHIETVTHLATA